MDVTKETLPGVTGTEQKHSEHEKLVQPHLTVDDTVSTKLYRYMRWAVDG
ncbi:hypothetical protein Tcan_03483 [Toxocara canis]|uniref:Uncharacterized protein n=1 Tax=Toxocara canis TaxID=6265 RepID=A0A0B2VDQ6_TOXCA|nr:hypothetical protein Tcan_03483 [Toxocara canis]